MDSYWSSNWNSWGHFCEVLSIWLRLGYVPRNWVLILSAFTILTLCQANLLLNVFFGVLNIYAGTNFNIWLEWFYTCQSVLRHSSCSRVSSSVHWRRNSSTFLATTNIGLTIFYPSLLRLMSGSLVTMWKVARNLVYVLILCNISMWYQNWMFHLGKTTLKFQFLCFVLVSSCTFVWEDPI